MLTTKIQTIQTEYGVYVPKAYTPVTERLTSVAPSIIESAITALRDLIRSIGRKPAAPVLMQHAKPAR